MIGRRLTRPRSTVLPRFLRGLGTNRATALSAGALAACASLTAGCGIIPGTGGTEDDRIVVMTWAPVGTAATNKPGMTSFARAYARWVNAHGGLGGRKLTVLTCNDHNNTVSAAACARRAVREKAVAVVGSYS
ncbi:ABC transporter substrate-binding protein, partial [Streptomyces sp. NPDC002920]